MDTPLIVPDRRALFMGFFLIGLQGFGGVLPWARRGLVERRRWLSDEDFLALLSLGQMLPGPNIVNMSVVLGARYQGWRGSVIALCGLLCAPFIIILLLAVAYDHYGQLVYVQHALHGMSAAAPGLLLATGWRLATRLERTMVFRMLAMATFGAVAILRLPMLWVLLLLAPVGIGLSYWWRRSEPAV